MNELIKLDTSLRIALKEIAEKYNSYFVKKEITYVYRDKSNKRHELVIRAQPQNFMHLCGIQCYGDGRGFPPGKFNSDSSKGAIKFYEDCLEGKIRLNDIFYEKIQAVQIKVNALKNMNLLFEKGVCICPSGNFERLTFDKALRTQKIILAITLINTSSTGLIPNSAIDLRKSKSNSKSFSETFRVTSISIKDLIDNSIEEKEFGLPPKKKKKKKKGN
ncbi:PBECR4 domain-containing protein [Enterococcus spodopteracolus]|uniref:PBECR4 domain-containing protein n=1 Tax=Enterococcus spodopteracolus TaxID=3034501 RepID=UPI0026482FC4|nr:PBECR4 domain-containing protein [Enterococcus spodopteracolus]